MTEVSFDKLCDSKIDIPVLPEGCSMTKAIREIGRASCRERV